MSPFKVFRIFRESRRALRLGLLTALLRSYAKQTKSSSFITFRFGIPLMILTIFLNRFKPRCPNLIYQRLTNYNNALQSLGFLYVSSVSSMSRGLVDIRGLSLSVPREVLGGSPPI